MFCIKCGKQLKDDARFCKFCGARVPEEFTSEDGTTDEKDKSNKEKEIDKTELIVDEDKGEETVLITSNVEERADQIDKEEAEESSEATGTEAPEEPEDDGETEIIDQSKTASVTDVPAEDQINHNVTVKEEAFQDKKKNELKYMGHVLDETSATQPSEESQGADPSKTKIVIRILSIVLAILILIAIGLGVYYYLDYKMLREKYIEELVLPDDVEEDMTEMDEEESDTDLENKEE